MKYLLLILFAFSGLNLSAQHDDQRGKHKKPSKERIEAQRIAFITNELKLTPEEAQNFWPIFNQYAEEKRAIRKEGKGHASNEALSAKEAEALINEHFQSKERGLALEKEYVEKFKSVLPSQKVLKLMFLERKFKEEVIRGVLAKQKFKN